VQRQYAGLPERPLHRQLLRTVTRAFP
jgi:hypothetical protein